MWMQCFTPSCISSFLYGLFLSFSSSDSFQAIKNRKLFPSLSQLFFFQIHSAFRHKADCKFNILQPCRVRNRSFIPLETDGSYLPKGTYRALTRVPGKSWNSVLWQTSHIQSCQLLTYHINLPLKIGTWMKNKVAKQ